jgi:hypothetical protein
MTGVGNYLAPLKFLIPHFSLLQIPQISLSAASPIEVSHPRQGQAQRSPCYPNLPNIALKGRPRKTHKDISDFLTCGKDSFLW